MFGIDSSELLLIAIVALVVIGPKELPGLLRTWGKWMAQMRGMAAEFRGHVDEMVRQSELDEVKKQLTSATGGVDLTNLDPTEQIKSHIQEGVAEGEKALAEAKSSLESAGPDNPAPDSPLAEPDSAPQIAAETPASEAAAAAEAPAETPAHISEGKAPEQEKPAKAAAE